MEVRSFTRSPFHPYKKNNQVIFTNIFNKTPYKQELTLFEAIDLVFMVFFNHDQTPDKTIKKICLLACKITNPSIKQTGIIHRGLTLIIHKFKKDPKK